MASRKNTIVLSLLFFGVLSFVFSSRALAALTTFYPSSIDTMGIELVLNPDSTQLMANDETLDLKLVAAEQVVTSRLAQLDLPQPYKVVSYDKGLVVTLPERANTPYVNSVIAQVGQITFIDGSIQAPTVGQRVEFGPKTNPDQGAYQTLFTGQEVREIVSPDPATGQIFHQIVLGAEAAERFTDFVQTRSGNYVCIVLDHEVISCSAMYHWAAETLEILPNLSSNAVVNLTDLSIFLESGPLPVPLELQPLK